jgi:hypothetical protein
MEADRSRRIRQRPADRVDPARWRPVLEQHIGRHISGIAMPGGGVDWSFARKLELGI